MNQTEITADLAATVDFIRNEITEHADSTAFEDAVELIGGLDEVLRAAKDAKGLLETEMLAQLEKTNTRTIGSRVFKRVRNRKRRFDHDKILVAVRDHAVASATSLHEAAELAAAGMRDLYLSRSSTAKVSRMEAHGVVEDQVSSWENQGWRLEVEELDPDD